MNIFTDKVKTNNKKEEASDEEKNDEVGEGSESDSNDVSEKEVEEVTVKMTKLTHKEKRKLKLAKAKEAEEVSAESLECLDKNFTISTSGATMVENALKVECFSMSAAGKDLLVNAQLSITLGRRYGLVGPNGHGK